MRVDIDKLNPMVLKIMNSILATKEDIPQTMIVSMVNYCLAEVASNLRGKLKLYDDTVKPLNYYGYIFAPSSTGKDLSLSSMNNIFINSFKARMEKGFEKHKTKHWDNRRMALVDEDMEEGDIDDLLKEEQRLVSGFNYRISSATEAGAGKYRVTSGLYKIGALNLVVDELGANYAHFRSLLSLMLSTYEDGNSEARQLKETGLSAVSGVPSNMLLYSSPALAFDGGATERTIIEDLEQGLARRSFFAYVEKPVGVKLTAEERVTKGRAKADANKGHSKDIDDYFQDLASPKYMYKEITITREAEIAFAEYQIECEELVLATKHISEVEKIELLNRAWKATRLSGIYAFISKEDTVSVEFAKQAIYVARLSGIAFKKVCNQKPTFERLFEFIAGREKTSEIDLVKNKWYTGNISQKRELLSLARAYGYENDHLFKIKEVEGVEFFSFIPMPKTDIDNITISISKDLTKGYKKKKVPFDVLHEVVGNSEFCYSAGTFKGGHRNKDNYEKKQNLIIIDIDDGMKLDTAKKMFNNYKCMMATTRNHQKEKNGITCDRFRIIFITDRTIQLDSETYSKFMQNIYDSLGVPADTSCKDSSRGYFGAEGEHWYSEGDKLFEISNMVPSTSKEIERTIMLNSSGVGSTTGVERILLEEAMTGSRNNTVLRWAMFIKDSGYKYDDAKEKVLVFNDKLPEPLPKRELEQTVLKTLQRSYK